MKRQLMAFAAIAAFTLPIVAPLAALAQDRGGRGQEDRSESPRRGGGREGRNVATPDTPRPVQEEQQITPARERPQQQRPDGQRGQGRPDRDQRPASADRPSDQNRPNRPNAGQTRPDRPAGDWNGNRPDRPSQGRPSQDRPSQGGNRPDRPTGGWNGNDNRPDRPSQGGGRPDRPNSGGNNGNGGWNGNAGQNRPGNWNRDRDRQRQDYRNRFDSNRWQRDWNRNQRSDWWRSDRRFRSWSGARIGFYFAPGYGYYSVPRQYYGQQFYEGQYLPSIFWRYQMDDYRTYGLGYPPEGTRWVYVDNSIYLIDQYDGYILDVVRNFWRW